MQQDGKAKQPDEAAVAQLLEMGFELQAVKDAWLEAGGNIEAALNVLTCTTNI